MRSPDKEIRKLEDHNFSLVDRLEVNNYSLLLLKENSLNEYELAMTSFDNLFTTIEDQAKSNKEYDLKDLLKIKKEFLKKTKEWTRNFGKIAIGSMNSEKTIKYYRILSKYFNISEVQNNIDPYGNKFSFFYIS